MAEVYGSPYFETARDKLKALMDALVVTMATGYDPALSYAYDYHNVADMGLNAVTIGAEASAIRDQREETVSSVGPSVVYDMQFSIRVHTDHVDGTRDRIKVSRLLNSVNNKLLLNTDLGDGYCIKFTTDLLFNEEFDESDTYGGQLSVVLDLFATNTQE